MKFYDIESSMGIHEVKITFQYQSYKGHIVEQIGGNCKGFLVMDCDFCCWCSEEIEKLKENTCKLKFNEGLDYDYFTLELTSENGDTCEFEVEYQELQEMIVAVEILSFKPEIQKHQESGE